MRQTRDSVKDIWGERTPYHGAWPTRQDMRVAEEPERWVQSCCVLCSNGCGLDIGVRAGRIVGVRGREVDRVSHGRLGPKGLHGWEANNSPDRLQRPLVRDRKGGSLREASWDETMDLIVRRSREIRQEYTADAIAFYSTGQLFIEDYYTLSVLGKAGLGTSQMDGNTRLCTATSAAALQETFGSDGQPGSYADIDTTDCIFLAGHNMASTQTVLWARILDRLAGPNPPRLVVLDPRHTSTAREATVRLTPKNGTTVAVLNGLLHLLIENGWIDQGFIDAHTVGFDKLRKTVAHYPPERVEEISSIPAGTLRQAAEILGTAPTLVSTVLQGLYQGNQATAAACQVNNLNLIRGMIGRPGCGVLQFNGQPTAQNTRETGCDGEYPAFRNPQNARHVEDLARIWNVDPLQIPHWHTPAHAMEIFHNAEEGSVRLLWIVGTNPAVSLPDLPRIRKILGQDDLFLVVQDAFLTETTQFADVILPAAIWGEKTGTFTNVDRTVHISRKAADPPGEAKSDMDIFLDYARRMDFRDKDGQPLITWKDPEGAFEAWKRCCKGWACDYSGLTYDKLSQGSGIQWPCTEDRPEGTERLYTDFAFRTGSDACGTFGHDLETGAAVTEEEYRAHDPMGRAILKAAHHHPPFEETDETYPFWLTTGRQVYHFHTRTKTGRSKELCDAAPDAFAQISPEDARRLGIADGEMVEIASRRATVRVPAKVGDIEPGNVFIPFHYGYWDEHEGRPRAANELTIPIWDPISKQPMFKTAAVQLRKAGATSIGEKAADLGGKVAAKAKETAGKVLGAAHRKRPHLADYLAILSEANSEFIKACDSVSDHHTDQLDVLAGLKRLKTYSDDAMRMISPFQDKYGRKSADEPDRLRKALFTEQAGAYGLMRDMQDLYLMAADIHSALLIVDQTAQALRDKELLQACQIIKEHNHLQQAWLQTRMKHSAPHTLTVPS